MDIKNTSVAIIGHYAKFKELNDGQTIKTRNLYDILARLYKKENIYLVDTYNWKKNPIKLFFNCVKAFKKSNNIVFLPAQNGVKIFVPLFVLLNKIYKKNIIYTVVGGWLADLIKNKKKLINKLKRINYILVETQGLKKRLGILGLNNVDILLNFKNIKVMIKSDISFSYKEEYKLCTFSRVMEEKGISDAILAVKRINDKMNKIIYTLSIYGPIEENYRDKLENLIFENRSFIKYKGVVDSRQSVKVLREYDLLVFPTKFKTEGLPGTIIDAFSSGIPVIYSNWDYCDEFFLDKNNGLMFEMGNVSSLMEVLENFYQRKYDIKKIKENCIESAKKYDSNNAIKALTKYLR